MRTFFLTVPSGSNLLEAIGKLAVAHTHLELILKYCVKTIADQDVNEALDATEWDSMSRLRVKVKKLFRELKPTEMEKNHLDALLGKATRLSEKRNSYMHRAWSETEMGKAIIKGDDHRWGPAPSIDEIYAVTAEILQLFEAMNTARLSGFIAKAVMRHKERVNG